jgi:hypothetical protein
MAEDMWPRIACRVKGKGKSKERLDEESEAYTSINRQEKKDLRFSQQWL